jgi:hypothetical protein
MRGQDIVGQDMRWRGYCRSGHEGAGYCGQDMRWRGYCRSGHEGAGHCSLGHEVAGIL